MNTDLLPDRIVTRHDRTWTIRAFGGPAPHYYVHTDKLAVLGPFVTGAHDEDEIIDLIHNDLEWA